MINLKNNTIFYLLLVLIILTGSALSYPNLSFDLYFNSKYIEYSKYFLSFCKNSEFIFKSNTSAFPIWGYGLIHLLFKSKLNILIFQQLLNFFTLVKLDQYLLNRKKKLIIYSRILILISLPYCFFHTQMWPKSVSSSILILAVLQLFYYLESKKIKNVIFSGLLFGVTCNFRSDYLILSFTLPIFILLWELIERKEINARSFKILIVPISVLILLIPWGMYTFKKTGHYLLTSSNTGHVFFIGLGQLPNNIWKITPRDDDPKMHQTLLDEFETDQVISTGYSENKFLKEEFKKIIILNPIEWLKKCLFAFRLLVLDPFYVGNVGDFQKNGISNIKEIRSLEESIYNFNYKKTYSLILDTKWEFSIKEILQIMMTILTKIIGFLLFILTFMLFFYSLIKSKSKIFKDRVLFLCFLIIGYQCAISVFAFHMPVYNTSIYLIYVILFVFLLDEIFFNQTVDRN